MLKPACIAFITAVICILAGGRISAADGPPFGRGPAKVVAAQGANGILSPQAEFRGTVYFKDVSEVATELRGKIVEVHFNSGEHVTKDQLLVRLDDELLRKDLGALRARLDRDRVLLEDAQVRLGRSEDLVSRGLSPLEQLDEIKFNVRALRFSVSAAQAEVERLEVQIAKSEIRAPFDGIALERPSNIGEWKNEGATVAVIARSNVYEIVVSLPEANLPYTSPGMELEVQIGPKRLIGRVVAVIPRGDVVTRTFPVKISVDSAEPLMEGMAALARMPIGERIECLMVPRDAVLNQQGQLFVFTIQDGIARRHPVRVLGYQDAAAGIEAPDLGPGQLFAVKGHDRLRDGDPVELVPVVPADLPARATGS